MTDTGILTDLGDWFTQPDPRELHRAEVGEAQERVKRRRRRPKRELPEPKGGER